MSYEAWGEPDDGPELPDGWLDEDDAQALRDENSVLRAALAELAALKDMRGRLELLTSREASDEGEEYERRKPLAWQAARDALVFDRDDAPPSVGDLASMVGRLALALRKAAPGNELSAKAADYLTRYKLLSPLRTDPTPNA